jgi:hypothetical protein
MEIGVARVAISSREGLSARSDQAPEPAGTDGRRALATVDPAVAAERVGDALVLIHLETNQIYELNPSAARIFELLRAGADREVIRGELAAEFEVAVASIDTELDRLLAELRERRITR